MPHNAVVMPHNAVGMPHNAVGTPHNAVGTPHNAVGTPHNAVGTIPSGLDRSPKAEIQRQRDGEIMPPRPASRKTDLNITMPYNPGGSMVKVAFNLMSEAREEILADATQSNVPAVREAAEQIRLMRGG